MDGLETTAHIRKYNTEALTLGLSADATRTAIRQGIRAGMNYYLTKPLDREKLNVILESHFKEITTAN